MYIKPTKPSHLLPVFETKDNGCKMLRLIRVSGEIVEKNLRHAGLMKRCCFPAAASESSFSTSEASSVAALRLDSIRAGVTDLGRTMCPLATF